MQRTVKSTKVTIATRNSKDTVTREFINVTDSNKVLKNLEKEFPRGSFMVIEEEIVEKTYILNDEIFFRYAMEVPAKNTTVTEG